MSDDKYEEVTGMSVGQVVDTILEGEAFYILSSQGNYVAIDCEVNDIKEFLEGNCLYRKIETPWWKKHIGSLVMVRDSEDAIWTPTILKGYSEGGTFPFYDKEEITWKQTRPLTAAEKDSIITEG